MPTKSGECRMSRCHEPGRPEFGGCCSANHQRRRNAWRREYGKANPEKIKALRDADAAKIAALEADGERVSRTVIANASSECLIVGGKYVVPYCVAVAGLDVISRAFKTRAAA